MAKSFKEKLGASLRRAREDRGLTQAGVAEAVGISPEALSRIERGVTAPKALTLLDLMKLLDLERDDLVRARPGKKKLPYPKEVMAIAEALARAPGEKVKAVGKIVKVVLGMR